MENFNTKLNTLKSDLVNTIIKSEIPVGAVYYMLKDLLDEVTDSYKKSLAIEQQIIETAKNIKDVEGHQE